MIETILETARKSDENVLIEGVHGIGKSQRVKEYALQNNMHLEILYLSHQEVGDLIGMPIIENQTTIWTKPSWFKRMEDASANGQECLLFLDELNRAQRDVRQTAMQITLEKKLHEHHLPKINGKETLVVAAINPEDNHKIDYQVDELDAALMDRFLYYEMKIDVKAWLNWARKNSIIDEIAFFITQYPDRLFFFTEDKIYPTPRSWAKLSQLLINAPKLKTNELKTIIYGKVGQAIGSQFYAFYKDFKNVITMQSVEHFIQEQKSLSKEQIVSKLKEEILKDKPKIWVNEIAQRLFDKYIKAKKDQDILIIYLNSIDLEILASLLESIKNEDKNKVINLMAIDGGAQIVRKISEKIEYEVLDNEE